MAGKGQLWDDSALIRALDDAVNTYKMMHEVGEKPVSKADENLPVCDESSEFHSVAHVKNGDCMSNVLDTRAETEETANLLQIKEDSPVNLSSPIKHPSSSCIHNSKLPAADENPAVNSGNLVELMVSSETKGSQVEAAWYSKSPEEYSMLLKKYYELEDQRQKILLQLQQFGSCGDQYPVSSTFSAEEHQTTAVQPLYDAVACYCSYGCQNWVVPCDPLPACCSGCTCIDKISPSIPEGGHKWKYESNEDPGSIRTAMVAAERTASSLMKESSIDTNVLADEEKDKEAGVQIGQFSKCTKSPTDLDAVLSAWYTAGFYTGKYVSENSFSERRKPSQGN